MGKTQIRTGAIQNGSILWEDLDSTSLYGNLDHNSLQNLTSTDCHTQYVHLSYDRTITANHTFAPGTVRAPFTLGTNAQGQLVTGLNSDLLDGVHKDGFCRYYLGADEPEHISGMIWDDGNGNIQIMAPGNSWVLIGTY